MKVSENGLRVLQYFESCKLDAYPDPGTGGDPWTVGWGATGPDIRKGVRWSQQQADDRLMADLAKFERGVSLVVHPAMRQGQFDAMVCLAYNIGLSAFEKSTLLRKFNAGDYSGAASEFHKWTRAGGQVMRGLVRRRAAEAALFVGFTGDSAIAAGKAA